MMVKCLGLVWSNHLSLKNVLLSSLHNPSNGRPDSGRTLTDVCTYWMYLSILAVQSCYGQRPAGSGFEKTIEWLRDINRNFGDETK